MDTLEYMAYLIAMIILFVGVLVWAFGRKRKKRFEQDGRLPFDK